MKNDKDLAIQHLAQRLMTSPARAVGNAPRQTSTIITQDGKVKREWLVGDDFSDRFYFREDNE